MALLGDMPKNQRAYFVEENRNGVSDIKSVKIICSRCGKTVDGLQSKYGTGGFYRVSEGHWAKYANLGEIEVCDSCMWADPRYKADYQWNDSGGPSVTLTVW